MQTVVPMGISVPKKIFDRIEAERGDISRSRYVLRLLEKVYPEEQELGAKSSP